MSRILIVEDSPTQAQLLQYILEDDGFEVEVALDGEQGLALLQTAPFDLVITDVLMPGISGYDLCRQIKADPARRHIPVILLTTLQDPTDIVQGIESGADNFIPKPFRPEDLIGSIRSLFANRALRANSKLKVGVEVVFLDRKFTITSEKEQILDLLLSTCEEIVRTNRDLQASQAELRAARDRLEQHNDQLRDRVRSSEERYRALMEQAGDAILILDSAGKVLEVNRRTEELLGLSRGHIINRSYEEFVSPADLERKRKEFQGLWATGSARADRLHFQRPDGSLVSIDLSASVVELSGERVVLAIAHDTTERDRLEQQLRQSQKMDAIGQLAGGVAHDFNNLLTVITGYGEMLLGRLGPDDPMGQMIDEILQAGNRAAALTSQLLAFSRQQVVATKVLDLNAVVADAAKMLRRLIGEHVELTSVLDPALGRVKADPGQIEQVLMNLAVNSRDAMPRGGKLTIETNNIDLDESSAAFRPGLQPGRYVVVVVTDTGCGMDEATRARVFEPFFTTKEIGKGTGLGLAVVYGIVKHSGGFISVYSEPGRGTAFKIYLPRVEAKIHREKVEAGPSRSPRGTETVLLVEDEEGVRTLTRLTLQMNGYNVLEACHGAAALRVAEQHPEPIHLLVTDVVMPRMGGRDLADRLTAQRPGLRVLFLSGYADDAVVRHGVLEAGVAFLQKPFRVDALARKVREVLDAEDSAVVCAGMDHREVPASA